MMEESEYVLHIDFADIKAEMGNLQGANADVSKEITAFVDKLKVTTSRVEPTLRKETKDERGLWEEYRQLQREKLVVLDLRHEYDYISQAVKDANPKLDVLISDAIEEVSDHISVLAESHRAHIDILEIYYTRKIEVLALVITAAISYLAVWEFFVRDLLTGLSFPYHLSPGLNYGLVAVSLLPVFVTFTWAWINRKSYF